MRERLSTIKIASEKLEHFDIHRETRIICDASHDGLGAVLEKYSASGWLPISFASRYPAAKKFSTNKLELLAVVWATELFRNYILFYSYIRSQGVAYTIIFFPKKGKKKHFLAG